MIDRVIDSGAVEDVSSAPDLSHQVPPVNGCFVAGTLVHTKEGLVPIEKLRIGDWVLSQPEMKGELVYRQVMETFAFEDKEVCLLEYFLYDEVTARSLVVTANHPFWVKDVGWTAAGSLLPGCDLELRDGAPACLFKVRRMFKTDIPDVGWTRDDNRDKGPTIDLRAGSIKVSKTHAGDTRNESAVEIGEDFKTRVFNIEVDGFHTYYVGEAGVWVHNTDCRLKESVHGVADVSAGRARARSSHETISGDPVGYPGFLPRTRTM